MSSHCRIVVAGLAIGVAAVCARAQELQVAALPWTNGATAGPNGSDYEPPNDSRDLWIAEDFGISGPRQITRFESYGTIFPAPLVVIDVTVQIWDAMPPGGNIVMSSLPGTGRVIVNGINYRIAADFAGDTLPAGNYWLVWSAATHTNPPASQIAIFWAQSGPRSAGTGQQDNAYQWNPGGAWGFPNNIRHVPADLSGNGMIGVNFYLFGRNDCYANCDGSSIPPILNIADFVCFQTRFAAGDSYANCDGSTTAPTLNIADFVCFMSHVAVGCP
jgi:hypothetical protein